MSAVVGNHWGLSLQETSEKCKSRHLEKNKKSIKKRDIFEFNLHPRERGLTPGMGKQFHTVGLAQKVFALADYWCAGIHSQRELY